MTVIVSGVLSGVIVSFALVAPLAKSSRGKTILLGALSLPLGAFVFGVLLSLVQWLVREFGGTASGGNIFGGSGLNTIATNLQVNALGLPISAIGTTPPGAGLYQILGNDYQATLRARSEEHTSELQSL